MLQARCNVIRWNKHINAANRASQENQQVPRSKYRKSYERDCISGFMSTKLSKLRTFKTSRVTTNPEMHEQDHANFYLLYIQQNYSVADSTSSSSSCSCSYSSVFFLSVAHVYQTFNQVCVVFNAFLFFAFSSSFLTMFWFDKANRLSAILFFIWSTNLVLPLCFHGNFRIALYLHSLTYL